jgi:hypothetical protein
MVTFALPGDNDAAPALKNTPRSRPPLPFAKRAFASSPYAASPRGRMGTPQSVSSRKLFSPRDEIPTSSLNKNSITAARNIFRASSISDSPPAVTPFSPNLPQSTMKRVFAPGATPEPTRAYRESTAQATPRGVAAKATDKELFTMRIADPDPSLTGEVLAQKVPKDWNSKASIYADQYLAHLCPAEFDDEQRRQFFCILDLRRLKYAANEIFCRKDWKLNVGNFAKEFEKSRSIILLRYGLYEFQNVKPSKEVLRRWRREHGLPEPEEEDEEDATPTKPAPSKKRKAVEDDENPAAVQASTNKAKRRATDKAQDDIAQEPPATGNKRKASVSDEAESQPNKMHKAPSGARSLFEKAVNKASATPASSPSIPASSSTSKPASNSLIRSVFNNNKQTEPSPANSNNNIFGYLSDASSAKNSGVDADGESETDSDGDESPEAAQSDQPSAKPAAGDNGTSSAAGTRESTPGRSLFDRVTKDSEGQVVRAEPPPAETESAAKDQTWNPSKAPIKFAPTPTTGASTSIFGASTASAGSVFAPKTSTTGPASNIFGSAKPDDSSKKTTEAEKPTEDAAKDGAESDKENDSQSASKSTAEAKQSPFPSSSASSLFAPKPTASTEGTKEAEAPKPASGLFGPAPTSSASTLFTSATAPAEPSKSVMQSSTLFGSKPTEAGKSETSETPKSTSLFGSSSAAPSDKAPAGSLFAPKPAASASNLFGSSSSAPAKPLFGGGASSEATTTTATAPTTTQPNAASSFSFLNAPGSSTTKANGSSAPLFGVPKSPVASNVSASAFAGSPMKQDNESPSKSGPTSSALAPTSAPSFSFKPSGGTSSTNIFGAASNPPTSNGLNGSNNTPGFGFNFSAGGGGASGGSSFNNPFAQAGSASGSGAATPNTGSGAGPGLFSFGASSGPASGGSSPFQFGGANGTSGASSGGLFSASKPDTNGTPAFGGSAATGSGSTFAFGASTSQSQQNAAAGSMFGNNQSAAAPLFNLQPPSGGASTGTSKSPFPGRKILPLKRRV